MAYYKLLQNEKIVDVADCLTYVRYNPKRNNIILSPIENAQGIVTENGNYWHLRGFYNFPVGNYETVEAVEISKEEYLQLKALNGKTVEEIIDNYTLYLIEEGLL